MKILIMNGSPHSHGNTAGMIGTFKTAAEQAGHEVTTVSARSTSPVAGPANTAIPKGTASARRKTTWPNCWR